MPNGECLNRLIEGVWRIKNGRDDSKVFEPWKENCLKCLSLLMGADQHYTLCFTRYVQHQDSLSLLAAGGLELLTGLSGLWMNLAPLRWGIERESKPLEEHVTA
jgi:hypothetical protein